ncbi:MAG: F0F1 ATP synthase subunit epsilon [Rhodobacteraceae bacterium]|jgi:F-type H+-transporting ATPase subunit epsilon|nr:F0F1 ATP synthase subunit epsilon [Paracoccaceae bacterium]
MAETMQFDLVSPERRLASFKVAEVQLPGAEGDMTVMPDHAPVITTLRPGVVRMTGPEGTQRYAVTGGFAEITGTSVSVLAERAMLAEPGNREAIEKHLEEAREQARTAAGEHKDMAEVLVADLAQLLHDMV